MVCLAQPININDPKLFYNGYTKLNAQQKYFGPNFKII